MMLTELLGITGDNGPNLEPVFDPGFVHDKHKLRDWFEATFAANVIYEAICEAHGTGSARTFAAMVELFTGAFWRRAGWGELQVINWHDKYHDPEIRQWAQEPVWVVRAASIGWCLKTAPYRGGFLGMAESDDGEAVWFNLIVHEVPK